MKWIEHIRTNSHDCDCEGIVRASLILRYMQEAANNHLNAAKPGHTELKALGLAFLLSRITLSFDAPLSAGDELDVETWACESRGVSFNRCYRILREGEVVAEASSVWGLVEVEAHRLVRVGELETGYGTDEPLELEQPRRVHIPREVSLALVGERQVVYSDLDTNRHMNNTNYPDMICDFVPDMTSHRMLSLSMSFANEARLGDVLKIYLGRDGGVWYFRSVRSDGLVNIEASFELD